MASSSLLELRTEALLGGLRERRRLEMEETVMLKLMIMMRSGRVVQLSVSNVELDWLYDKMFGREDGKFQNLGQTVICVDDIEYLEWAEVAAGEDGINYE